MILCALDIGSDVGTQSLTERALDTLDSVDSVSKGNTFLLKPVKYKSDSMSQSFCQRHN